MYDVRTMTVFLKTAILIGVLLFPAGLPAQESRQDGVSRGISIVPTPEEERRKARVTTGKFTVAER